MDEDNVLEWCEELDKIIPTNETKLSVTSKFNPEIAVSLVYCTPNIYLVCFLDRKVLIPGGEEEERVEIFLTAQQSKIYQKPCRPGLQAPGVPTQHHILYLGRYYGQKYIRRS